MLLQERTARATLEDDEEELEDDEIDGDERGDGPTRIVPRRPGEFLCSVVLPRAPARRLADEERKLCATAPDSRRRRSSVSTAFGGRATRTALDLRPRRSRAAGVVRACSSASLPAVRPRAARARRVCVPLLWAWRDATPGRRGARRLRASGSPATASCSSGSATSVRRDRPARHRGSRVRRAAAGALVALFLRRGYRSPLLVAAVWVVLEALRGRWPLGGFPWAELGVALHDLPWARALASVGGVLLVTFVVVAVNGLLLDLIVAAAAPPDSAAVGSPRARSSSSSRWWRSSTSRGSSRRPPAELRFALLQGNDQNRTSRPTRFADYLTASTSPSPTDLEGHYDLIVFPESALERDPDDAIPTSANQLTRSRGSTTRPCSRTRASPRPTASSSTPTSCTPRRRAAGHLLEAAPRAVRRVRAVARPAVVHRRARPDPVRLRARRRRRHVRGRRPPGRQRDLLRVGVRAARARLRARRRGGDRGEHQQPLVPALGESAQHLALSQMRAAETGRPVLQASVSGISGGDRPRRRRARRRPSCSRTASPTVSIDDDDGGDALRAASATGCCCSRARARSSWRSSRCGGHGTPP